MNTGNKVLLVIDMQNGFNKNDQTRTAVEALKDLLDYEPAVFTTRIFTRYVNVPSSPHREILGWDGCADGSDIEIVDALKGYVDKVMDKSTYAVTGMFPQFLPKNKVREVYIAGFNTETCVMATALHLFDMGIKPVIIQNCCASSSINPYAHRHALGLMETTIGRQNIVTSGELKVAQQRRC